MPDWYRNGRELPADAEGKMLFGVPAGMDPGVGVVSGRRVSMAQFCDYLQYPLHAPVLDETSGVTPPINGAILQRTVE